MDPEDETVGQLVSRLTDELAQQAALHVELAKAELARDAKALLKDAEALGKDAAPLAIAVPLLGLGYVFACVALALALVPWIGAAGGLAIVGALNLIAGGVAAHTSVTRLRSRGILRAPVGATSSLELPHVS
ncbi:MAG: phage holin family protein [Pseudomonadota bacterium]|nr:phage holin family protein [Pseudomonadota bacterium]